MKIACLGAGYFAQFHHDAWRRINSAELVGVCDQDASKAKGAGVAGFADLDHMLTETQPDILDIITPPHTHLEAITKGLAAGVKAIICQKPFCSSLEDARTAVARAKDAGIPLIIHENFRFQPWYRAAKMMIDDGLLGGALQITFRLRTGDGQGPDAYLDRQPYFQQMPRFLVHETAVHWVDTFRYLLGAPTSVYADLRQVNPAISGEDAGHILFSFSNGARALFDGNRLLDHAAENHRLTFGEALIEGTKGAVELRGDGSLHFRAQGDQSYREVLPVQDWKGFAGDCVYALQFHVVDCLRCGRDFENEAEDYLLIREIEELIYQSSAQGKRLEVT